MTDFCVRCATVVYVIAESRPGYTRWYCCRCGMTTDQYWDEDSEYLNELPIESD